MYSYANPDRGQGTTILFDNIKISFEEHQTIDGLYEQFVIQNGYETFVVHIKSQESVIDFISCFLKVYTNAKNLR